MKVLRLWCSVFFLTACSIADKTTYEDPEGALPETFFSDIGNGKTRQEWVVAQLGDPEEIQQGPEAQQIYSYRLARLQKKHANLLLVLRYDGVARETEYFHVFFDNGIVKKHWRDGYLQVQASRYFKASVSTMEDSEEADQPIIMDTGNTDNYSAIEAPPPVQDAKPETKKYSAENRYPYPEMKSPAELWPNQPGT